MAKLTIVIVNYNVQYFLEQCLLSVQKAIKSLPVEVYVVDNNSVDGSVSMVEEKFPWVKLIANKDNLGFSKANNQAMRLANGEYVLLLNPDTVIEEDTLVKVVDFMDTHPDAGGLGVHMVDGKGHFLPESKRGLPTPATSFYKIFGISRLFPKSAKFNRYHLGNLSKTETHEIEILSGAFMLMRKKALDQVGLLDEDFFMYGEDIDLSWRIVSGGWKNYYYPGTSIIHYKGESTKKGSLNYVFVFYNAMVIFARKHFSQKNADLFSFFINMAIWLRAGVAVMSRFARTIALPLADGALTLAGWWWLKKYYATWQHKVYDDHLVWAVFGANTLVYLFAVWLNGGYDKPLRALRVVRPILTGSALIVIMYSLLPEDMRFSRALILGGTAVALLVFLLNRFIAAKGKIGADAQAAERFAIVGATDEVERVVGILQQTRMSVGYVASVSPSEEMQAGNTGTLAQLDDIVRVHSIDQIIFSARDVSSSTIISTMSTLAERSLEFKIAPPETLYLIGSNSIETSGDIFIVDVNSLSKPINQRQKRVLDVALSLLFVAVMPVLVVLQKRPVAFLQNLVQVFFGRKTWVGFKRTASKDKLPSLKTGVLHPLCMTPQSHWNDEIAQKLNLVYAKDYKVANDLTMIWKNVRNLGA
jgi:GT2 family glycosyltransferase